MFASDFIVEMILVRFYQICTKLKFMFNVYNMLMYIVYNVFIVYCIIMYHVTKFYLVLLCKMCRLLLTYNTKGFS